jgi:imidazolonepropionase-like amidohydrolase
MSTSRWLAVSCALVLLATNVRAQTESPSANDRDFVVRGVRIFDGSRIATKGDVWVQSGLIRMVATRVNVPPGVRVIDGTGRTLLPGLIDSHVHTMGERDFLRSALALGVTTELDMGAAPRFADEIEKEQAEGRALDLADLRSSRTQPTAPDGHGTEYGIPIPTISSPEQAQPLIDSLVAEGADFIGEIVYDDGSEYGLRIPTLSKETLRAVIAAAHKRGKLAVVHTLSLQRAKEAIDAGADGLVHLFTDRAPDSEFVSLVVAHHAFVIPTLSLLASMAGTSGGPALAQDSRLEPFLTSQAIADLNSALPRPVGTYRYAEEAVRWLRAQNVRILAGTDGHNPGTAHGASLLDELRLLVSAGLSPTDALRSATLVNARAFWLNDRGQIVPGKRADLLLVSGDPTTRIADIKNVVAVWKRGVEVDREGYRNALAGQKQAEAEQRRALPPPGSESGLVSDFEDGTLRARFGLCWSASAGRLLGGRKPDAHVSVVDGGASHSGKALQITGAIDEGVFGWAGAAFLPGPAPMAPVNLSSKKAISFWTRGDGKAYQVMLLAKSRGSMPLVKGFTAGPDWAKVTLPLSEFGTDASDLRAVTFAAVAVPGPFTFLIDDVRFEP